MIYHKVKTKYISVITYNWLFSGGLCQDKDHKLYIWWKKEAGYFIFII